MLVGVLHSQLVLVLVLVRDFCSIIFSRQNIDWRLVINKGVFGACTLRHVIWFAFVSFGFDPRCLFVGFTSVVFTSRGAHHTSSFCT